MSKKKNILHLKIVYKEKRTGNYMFIPDIIMSEFMKIC